MRKYPIFSDLLSLLREPRQELNKPQVKSSVSLPSWLGNMLLEAGKQKFNSTIAQLPLSTQQRFKLSKNRDKQKPPSSHSDALLVMIPGLFGFDQLLETRYFGHLEQELKKQFQTAGIALSIHIIAPPPTASIRHRSRIIAKSLDKILSEEEPQEKTRPIYLLGHSTGGIDLRLLLSPAHELGLKNLELNFLPRVQALLCMNTPHYGTPLATYFASVSGSQLLYGLSFMTVLSLALGDPSIELLSLIPPKLSRIFFKTRGSLNPSNDPSEDALFEHSLDESMAHLPAIFDSQARAQLRDYFKEMGLDRGALLQIGPEAMDLFQTSLTENPMVRYGSVVSYCEPKRKDSWFALLRQPLESIKNAQFKFIYSISAKPHPLYTYASDKTIAALNALDTIKPCLSPTASDGVVPSRSMIAGQIVWSGKADHLDVLGHFRGNLGPKAEPSPHRDWMSSGSNFDEIQFKELCQAIAHFFLNEN